MKYHAPKDKLLPGDIIFFINDNPTSTFQKLISNKHGVDIVTHAAICLGEHDGKSIIRHMVYPKPEDAYMYSEDNYIIYRNNDENIRRIFAEKALGVDIGKVSYDFNKAIKGFLTPSALSPDREKLDVSKPKEIDEAQFCSKFITQVVKSALHSFNGTNKQIIGSYPNIRSASTPKTVEADFHRMAKEGHYTAYLHPGVENPLEALKNIIKIEARRIEIDSMARGDLRALHKANRIRVKLSNCINNAELDQSDYLQQSYKLLKELIPILKENTGFGIRTATSYKNVIKAAAEMGIFERDLSSSKERSK